MKILSLEGLIPALLNAFRRFPLSLTVAYLATLIYLWLFRHEDKSDYWTPILFAMHVGFPLLVGAQLIHESILKAQLHRWLLYLVGIILVVILGYYTGDIESPEYSYSCFLSFFASVLMVSFTGFLKEKGNTSFWIFNQEVFVSLFLTVLYTILLIAGLEGAVAAIRALFEFKWYEQIYSDIPILVIGFFSTSYWAANLPEKLIQEKDEFDFYKQNLIVVKFILIPLTILYFLILYSYGLKILLQWNLPEGWVGSLCLGFSMVGVFTYLLNYLLPEYNSSKILWWFRKYFFLSLIPVLILLAVAIIRRILDYGLTEERILVAAAGFWLFLISMHFVFQQEKLKLIPISLAIFCLLLAFGPTSVYELSWKSQEIQLNKFADRNGLVHNGLWKTDIELDAEKMERFRNIVLYLSSRGKLETLISKISNEQDRKMIKETDKYLQTDLIVKTLNYKSKEDIANNDNISYNLNGFVSVSFEDLEGSLIAEMSAFADQLSSESKEKYKIDISEDQKDVTLTISGYTPIKLNLIDSLQLKYNNSWGLSQQSKKGKSKLYHFVYNLGGLKYTILLREFSIIKSKDGYKIESLRADLLK